MFQFFREDIYKSIHERLLWLRQKVEDNNSLNLTDVNIHAEYFYRGLLNLILDCDLENVNIGASNVPAIDLGDKNGKLAIQVTSNSRYEKTEETVKKFVEYELHEKYERLIILNITKKASHRNPTIDFGTYSFNTREDVWDIADLMKQIQDIEDPDRLEEIVEYLKKEIRSTEDPALHNEAGTILGIITYISDDSHPNAGKGEYIEEPDPDGKINHRFEQHSTHLNERYLDLNQEYGAVLKQIQEEADFGTVKLRRAALHLKGISDKILNECEGNPIKAMDEIVSYFATLLSNNRYNFNHSAAEFYIVDQLIRCNVFPNRENYND